MPNKNRNKKNQPPTGEGKKQSPRSGAAHKLSKRSEVLQAGGFRQHIGTAEDAGARIENDLPRTTAGSLAKIVHARIKLNAKDYAGAASLLEASATSNYTVIGDYALWLRGNALEQLGRRVEARAAYEKLS